VFTNERLSHRHDDLCSDATCSDAQAADPHSAVAAVELCPSQEHTRWAGSRPAPTMHVRERVSSASDQEPDRSVDQRWRGQQRTVARAADFRLLLASLPSLLSAHGLFVSPHYRHIETVYRCHYAQCDRDTLASSASGIHIDNRRVVTHR